MSGTLRLYSKELLPMYLFVCVLFVMGVVFGALLVNSLTVQQKQDVNQYLSTFVSAYSAHPSEPGPAAGTSVWETFGSHARWVFAIWVLGLSVVGVPVILLLDFLKGVLIGFTVGYLAGQWSWQGMAFALASVAPQNVVAVPSIVICSVAAISFSMMLVRNRVLRRSDKAAGPLAAFTFTVLLFAALLFGVSLFEVYVSPELLQWAVPILLQQV